MRRHDRRVFNTGISLAAGIGKYIVLVESNKEHCGSTVTAGSHGIELCERLCRLEHIDMLLLQVFCSGCQPSRRQDGVQLFGLHLAVTIFFAGITGFDHFFEFHIHTSRFSRQKLPLIVVKIRVPALMVRIYYFLVNMKTAPRANIPKALFLLCRMQFPAFIPAYPVLIILYSDHP